MNIIFLSLSLFVILAHAQSCVHDYTCGNIPYRYCAGGEDDCSNTLEGFGIAGNNIYYAQICRTNHWLSNITFKRVTTEGSVPVDIYTRIQQPAAVNPNKVFEVVNNHLYYDIVMRQPGRGLRALNVNTGIETTVTTDSFLQSYIEFGSQKTYLCNYRIASGGAFGNYTIERYPKFPTTGSVSSEATLYMMPSSNTCGGVRLLGSDLFFLDYVYSLEGTTTHFYRGTTSCSNCPLPAPFYTVPERVIDFDVSSNHIYYGTESGLFRITLGGSSFMQLSAEKASGVRVVGSKVFINNGIDIKSINLDGTGSTLLSFPPIGTCVCRPTFSGSQCETCVGQVQWDYVNRPNCVPTDLNGIPASCTQDWHCGNVPYTYCTGTYGGCSCRPNFSGPKCDVCTAPKKITWTEYGIPECA